MKLTLAIVCALASIVNVKSCTRLYAQEYSQTFDSHGSYGSSNYGSFENSCWIIEAPDDKVVYLNSESFNLEDDDCRYDSVKVYDGDSILSPLDLTTCGNVGVPSYTSSGRYAYVTFVTDEHYEYEGFRMSYKSVEGNMNSCTHLYAEDYSQTFDSHGSYGYSNYGSFENSCWIIEAPDDKVVYLNSETFSLEDDCSLDSVKVYDGDSFLSPMDLTICGNDGVHSYTSSGQYAYVTFETNWIDEYEGFRMSYKSVEADDNPYLNYQYDETTSLSVGVIVGIIIGSLLGLALLIGIIVCVVVMVASTSKRGAVHNRNSPGQNTTYTNQGYYPGHQMYVTAGYKGGVIVASSNQLSTQQAKAPLQATQQQVPTTLHPVDPNGVPLPAVYNAP